MKNTTRYNEVISKLNKMFKNANEENKDKLVSQMKNWLKTNPNDKSKKEAIQCFLAEQHIF